MSLLSINLMISMKNKKIIIFLVILAFVAGSFFYFSNRVYYSHGTSGQSKILEIEKGEGVVEIGKKFEKEELVSNYIYFIYYLWSKGINDKMIAGKYSISPQLTIPKIAIIITEGETISSQVKLTFPEGWSVKKMTERLNANGLPGDDFSSLINNPDKELISEFNFLADKPASQSLEGYMFPDTYFFYKNTDAEGIIKKLLDNFDNKMADNLRQEIKKQGKSIFEIVTMASVIENEVRIEEDRKIVSDIFWRRISIGQPLQSCATLAYILGINKKQYSLEDTMVESPYNTYANKGLPPGPISNPGIKSIEAAIYPIKTNYNYFLSDPATGETVFSRTVEEHNANKDKHGL